MDACLDEKANYYQILGLDPSASDEDLKRAFREKAVQFHPDKNPEGLKHFRLLTEAYEILKDPIKRKAYDRQQETLNRLDRFSSSNLKGPDLDSFVHQELPLSQLLKSPHYENGLLTGFSLECRCGTVIIIPTSDLGIDTSDSSTYDDSNAHPVDENESILLECDTCSQRLSIIRCT